MKWIYGFAGLAVFFKLLLFPLLVSNAGELAVMDWTIVDLENIQSIVSEAGIPNSVSGIIFRNRLYDTIFEAGLIHCMN